MFDVVAVNYKEKCGNLNAEAKGTVKSEKHFPLFEISGTKYVFKPLSKTKPFTTGMFSIAEVYWSNIINKYFIKDTPIYRLAICKGYSDDVPKYYEYGCIVPYILQENEYLYNVYELFEDFPDKNVDIHGYINYCMLNYDWTKILSADIFKKEPGLRYSLAFCILISMLKGDQNYHYENAAFICNKNDKGKLLRISPMLDHEFSTPFLFPDDLKVRHSYSMKYGQELKSEDSILYENISYICMEMPYIAEYFLKCVKSFKKSFQYFEDKENSKYYKSILKSGFLYDCASDSYLAGQCRYKKNNEERARKWEQMITLKDIKSQAGILWDDTANWIKGITVAVENAVMKASKMQ